MASIGRLCRQASSSPFTSLALSLEHLFPFLENLAWLTDSRGPQSLVSLVTESDILCELVEAKTRPACPRRDGAHLGLVFPIKWSVVFS